MHPTPAPAQAHELDRRLTAFYLAETRASHPRHTLEEADAAQLARIDLNAVPGAAVELKRRLRAREPFHTLRSLASLSPADLAAVLWRAENVDHPPVEPTPEWLARIYREAPTPEIAAHEALVYCRERSRDVLAEYPDDTGAREQRQAILAELPELRATLRQLREAHRRAAPRQKPPFRPRRVASRRAPRRTRRAVRLAAVASAGDGADPDPAPSPARVSPPSRRPS